MKPTVLLLGLTLTIAGTAAAQGWRDDFDQAALDARWTWRVPVEGPAFSLQDRPGWLRIGIPQRENGFNHWNNPQADDAPQLRAPVIPGDWELEARIELVQFDPTNHLQAGIMVGTGDAQLLTLGLLQGPGLPGGPKTPEVWFEPTGHSGYAKLAGEVRAATLRITKQGNLYRAQARREGGDWEAVGTYALAEEPAFVGVIGKTFSNGPAVVFDVDYVSLQPLAEAGADRGAPAAAAAPPAAEAPAVAAPAPATPPEAPASVQATGALESGGDDPGAPQPAASASRAGAADPEVVALARRLCDVGDRCLRQKRYADAEACYRMVLLHLPQSPRALAGLKRVRAAGR